jgi:uncharacterized protein (TIGR00299 family) protein
MRGLYLDCSMGAAGDMLSSALFDLLGEGQKAEYLSAMNALFSQVEVRAEKAEKMSIAGQRLSVLIQGQEESGAAPARPAAVRYAIEISSIMDSLPLPAEAKKDALAVFGLLFEAESAVHGQPVGNIHLHEVGSLDAICDISGFCLLMRMLGIARVDVSPVNTGEGTVQAAHGVLPVPAPATARILIGAKIFSDGTASELCTPTGAAILMHFAHSFGPMPPIAPIGVGYGMGKKDFARPNCVRAFLYEMEAGDGLEEVVEITANIDDMTPESLAFACEALLAEGALDAFVTPIVMKKGRPAFLLTCLALPKDRDRMARLALRHTTSIGARFSQLGRYALARTELVVDTEFGPVRAKESTGFGVRRRKAEFEDLKRIAAETGLSLEEVQKRVSGCFVDLD